MKRHFSHTRLVWGASFLFAGLADMNLPAQAVVIGNSFSTVFGLTCAGSVGSCTTLSPAMPGNLRIRHLACTLGGTAVLNRFTLSAHLTATAGAYASITRPVVATTSSVKIVDVPVFNEQFGMPFASGGFARMTFFASQPGSIAFSCTIAGTIP